MVCIYIALFSSLMTTQSALLYSLQFTRSHTHSYSAFISTLFFNEGQFGFQPQGHFGMQMGKTGIKLPIFLVGGRPLYHSARAACCMFLYAFFTTNILTCHSRKSTRVNINITVTLSWLRHLVLTQLPLMLSVTPFPTGQNVCCEKGHINMPELNQSAGHVSLRATPASFHLVFTLCCRIYSWPAS